MRLPNHVLTWLLDLVLHLDIWFFKGDLYPKPPTCTTKVPWTRYVLTLLVQYVKQPVRGLTNRRSSGWVDPWRIILGSPPFIAAMIHGHLLKGSTHPIRKGDENYSNHSCEPLAEWDDPPSYCTLLGFRKLLVSFRKMHENPWRPGGANRSPRGTHSGTNIQMQWTTTPLKFNMEPKNCPVEKDNHLPNLHFGVPC